jgi:hypothetical protein
MITEEIDAITEKLNKALETSGLSGCISFKGISVYSSEKESTGYCAGYHLSVILPDSSKGCVAKFGGKITP